MSEGKMVSARIVFTDCDMIAIRYFHNDIRSQPRTARTYQLAVLHKVLSILILEKKIVKKGYCYFFRENNNCL